MKKFLPLYIILSLFITSYASNAEDDFWDAPMQIDTAAKNQQRAVTDQEFEKVMSQFEKKKNKKEAKKRPKGAPIGPQIQDDVQPLNSQNAFKVTYEDYPTVMVPVTLVTYDNTEIPPGFYRILSVKKENEYYLNFYQGNSLIAKVAALETGNDYNQASLNYAKLIPNGNESMNIIYGDIDCNIEARIYIKR